MPALHPDMHMHMHMLTCNAAFVQEMAESLDTQLQRAGYLDPGVGPFGAWTLQRTLRDMNRFLAQGFEVHQGRPNPPRP